MPKKYNKRGGAEFKKYEPGETMLIQNEMNAIKKDIRNIDPYYNTIPDKKKFNTSNVEFNINYQTMFATMYALVFMILQIMVFKKTDLSYYYIILLVFVWPIIIELLARYMKGGKGIVTWILAIMPLTIILMYEAYKYNKNASKRALKKLRKKEDKEDIRRELMRLKNKDDFWIY